MLANNSSTRNYSLDLLKVIAVVFITNSHFVPIYKDVNIAFATFGMHGNALFFFVSGFLMIGGLQRNDKLFVDWYARKLRRVLPPICLWCIAQNLIWGKPMYWEQFLIASDYWFIRTIMVYYVLFFFVAKVMMKRNKRVIALLFVASVVFPVMLGFVFSKEEGSIFHAQLHYYVHFSVMMLGGITCLYKERITFDNRMKDMMMMVLSFVSYFLIMKIGKGKTDWLYYTQLFGLIPIYGFCYYLYKVFNQRWCVDMLSNGWCIKTVLFVSSLTLEIYIVQFKIITDRLNHLFPFNIIVVFLCIFCVAYLLRVVTNVFLQIMGGGALDVRTAIRVY